MKQKAFFIILTGLLLKQIKHLFSKLRALGFKFVLGKLLVFETLYLQLVLRPTLIFSITEKLFQMLNTVFH